MEIIQVVGAPTEETWPGVSDLPCFMPFGAAEGPPPRSPLTLFAVGTPTTTTDTSSEGGGTTSSEGGGDGGGGASRGGDNTNNNNVTEGFAELVDALLRANPAARVTVSE